MRSVVRVLRAGVFSKPFGTEKNRAMAPIRQAERVLNGTGGTGFGTILCK